MPPHKKTASVSNTKTLGSNPTSSSQKFIASSYKSAKSDGSLARLNDEYPFIVEDGNGHSSSEFESNSIHSSDDISLDGSNSEKADSGEELKDKSFTAVPRSYRHNTQGLTTPTNKGMKRPIIDVAGSEKDILVSETSSLKKSKIANIGKSRACSALLPGKKKIIDKAGTQLNKGKMKTHSADQYNNDNDDISSVEEITVKPLVYLEDYDKPTNIPKLKVCGVFDKAFEDPFLKGTYNKLIKLPSGKSIETWKKTYGNQTGTPNEAQFMMFSTVNSYFPGGPIDKIKKILVFSGDKHLGYANLSRINPAELIYKPPSMGYRSSFICYRGQNQPAKLLMMGIVVKDQTKEPFQLSGPKGNWMKSFTICPFALEFERNITVTCLITGVDSFAGQIYGNELTFTTRQGPLDDSKPSLSSLSKCGRTPIFAGPSNAVKHSPGASYKGGLSTKGPSDPISILDARDRVIKLPMDLKTLESSLPSFNGPVPPDSVALVCYTNGGYMKDDKLHLSHNILWAAVLEGSRFNW